ncbi:MAG TPA: hypothetical protein PLS73_14080, partial [Saprospiraceae bacterium]|nr:hypothetical protein [Saprospiraceae bacterium]
MNEAFCNISYRFYSTAIHSNGDYNVLTWSLSPQGKILSYLKRWDPFICDTSLIATGEQTTNSNFHCLFIDYLGRTYYSTSIKNLNCMYRCEQGLHDPKLVLNYANGFSNREFDDMVIIRDKIIGLDVFSNSIYILDTSFNLLGIKVPPYQITKLTSLYYTCDSFDIIATGYQISNSDYRNLISSGNNILFDSFNLFKYDPFNNSILLLCNYFSNDEELYYNTISLTSFGDILNSDPECDLLLDLDRNNSSGLYPYNFKLDRMVCNKELYPICDTDVYLHTNLALDSMQFRLTGIKDIGLEFLIGTNMPVGFLFIQRSDSLYSLIGNANSPDLSFMNALRSIYYRHTGITNRTDGERVIHIEGYSPIKKGQTV